jgi:hypothetical protein
MIIQRINRSDPDKAFIIVDNGEGATLPSGGAVIWDTTTDANGLLIRQPDTGKLHGFAGCLAASMASVTGSYTLCQCYGYKSDALVFQTDTTQAAGLELVPTAGANYLASVASTTASNSTIAQQPIYAVLLESVATSGTSATPSKKVFIRAM